MKKSLFSADLADLLFRLFFCSIFLILGIEHLFRDHIIQTIMPTWFPEKRTLSLLSGLILIGAASLVLVGYKSRAGALILSVFLVLVTLLVHAPALAGIGIPPGIPPEWQWLWDLFQRSNFVKNLCLLGVCIHLMHHKVGKYSLEHYLNQKFRPMSL